MTDLLVALDPGRRLGVAWVTRDGRLVRHEIIDVGELDRYDFADATRVVVGDGTGSAGVSAGLGARGIDHDLVDERGTSEEARSLYWRDHPPRGLARLVPLGMRAPPRSIDDYAAYAIALRVLAREPAEEARHEL
jgi:hypothetical protein